jgi:hypothetical protein
VVQASLKAVLEPIFEADFQPVSYGFWPSRMRTATHRNVRGADADHDSVNVARVELLGLHRRQAGGSTVHQRGVPVAMEPDAGLEQSQFPNASPLPANLISTTPLSQAGRRQV